MPVETNINRRWEQGMPHHPRSEALYRIIADMDLRFGDDYFCFKSGGDGDNGEHLMYLLDIHFETEDENNPNHDYYFMKSDDPEDDLLFYIVHKRYWHLRHCIYDQSISGDVTVPASFAEVSESTFETESENGIQELTNAGFTYLENPFWNSLVVLQPTIGGIRFRVDLHADTQEWKDRMLANAGIVQHPFATLADLWDRLQTWAATFGGTVGHFNAYGTGCYAYLIDQAVLNGLPPTHPGGDLDD